MIQSIVPVSSAVQASTVFVCNGLQPKKIGHFDDFPQFFSILMSHLHGRLHTQNKNTKADVPKTRVAMRLCSKIPTEQPYNPKPL
jgi:hypothetical protein